MDVYQLSSIVGDLAIFLGVAVIGIAFLLPKGWRSWLGLLCLSAGGALVAASVLHTPDGPTYSRYFIERFFS